ncbi:hypothetical protein [Nocardioides bruguierae]|uniref:Uncharacterized protein n=1 Tax=Nocardioides bruguierae TaxID=2945102 RepID=A0A9X2DAY9_9ACTN|nr:hypothetical protein [Nocardioides bruguierae]MCM0622605.1 hypothetical protein [Nocardioides bruguierae]
MIPSSSENPHARRVGCVRVADTQTIISQHITELVGLLPALHDLTTSRQRSLGFMTTSGAEAADRLAREERADRLAQPDRGQDGLGQDWLNRDHRVAGTGRIPAPGNERGVLTDVDVTYVLAWHTHRLEQHLRRNHLRVPGDEHRATRPDVQPTRPMPRPRGFIGPMPEGPATVTAATTVDTTPTTLAHRLRALVMACPSRTLLPQVDHDLRDLVDDVRLVVEGNDRVTLPWPCPWCGDHTLVQYLHDAVFVRCEANHRARRRRHPCVCPYPLCECKADPIAFRHEWHMNPTSKLQRPIEELVTRVTREKEATMAETRARDAVTAVRDLHTHVTIHAPATSCPAAHDEHFNPVEHDHEHVDTGYGDGPVCLTCPPAYVYCDECSRGRTDVHIPWPCPTLQAIDAHDPVPDPADDTQAEVMRDVLDTLANR